MDQTPKKYAINMYGMFWNIMFKFGAQNRRVAAKACVITLIEESINAIHSEGITASDRIDFYEEAKTELEKL